MPILRSYYQDVYRSPVVRLDGYSGRHGLTSSILAYLDFGGATGTSKDGLAETMLAFATERGALQPGMPVVEASSGSFGAALAVSCATTGHPCILVVPSNLPIARRQPAAGTGRENRGVQQRRPPGDGSYRPRQPNATTATLPTTLPTMTPGVSPPGDRAADLEGRPGTALTPSSSVWAAAAL